MMAPSFCFHIFPLHQHVKMFPNIILNTFYHNMISKVRSKLLTVEKTRWVQFCISWVKNISCFIMLYVENYLAFCAPHMTWAWASKMQACSKHQLPVLCVGLRWLKCPEDTTNLRTVRMAKRPWVAVRGYVTSEQLSKSSRWWLKKKSLCLPMVSIRNSKTFMA